MVALCHQAQSASHPYLVTITPHPPTRLPSLPRQVNEELIRHAQLENTAAVKPAAAGSKQPVAA